MAVDRNILAGTLGAHLSAFKKGEAAQMGGKPLPIYVLNGFEQEYGLEPLDKTKKFHVDGLRERLIARRTSLLNTEVQGRDIAAEIKVIESNAFVHHKLALAQEINDRLSQAGIVAYNFGADNYDYDDIAELRSIAAQPVTTSNRYSGAIGEVRKVAAEFGYKAHFGTHKSGSMVDANLQPKNMHPRTHISVSWNVFHEGKWQHLPNLQTEEAFQLHQQLSFGALIALEHEGLGARQARYQTQDTDLYSHLRISSGRNAVFRVGKINDEYRCPGLLPDILLDETLMIGGGRYREELIALYPEKFAAHRVETIAKFNSTNYPELQIALKTGYVNADGYFVLPKGLADRYLVNALNELLGEFWPECYSPAERNKIYADFSRLLDNIRLVDNRLDSSACGKYFADSHPVLQSSWAEIIRKIDSVTLSGTTQSIAISKIGRRQTRLVYAEENLATSQNSTVLGNILGSEKDSYIEQSFGDLSKKYEGVKGRHHALWELRDITAKHKEKNPAATNHELLDVLANQIVTFIEIAPKLSMKQIIEEMVKYAAQENSSSRAKWGSELADLLVEKYSAMLTQAASLFVEGKNPDETEFSSQDKTLLKKLVSDIALEAEKTQSVATPPKVELPNILAMLADLKREPEPPASTLRKLWYGLDDLRDGMEIESAMGRASYMPLSMLIQTIMIVVALEEYPAAAQLTEAQRNEVMRGAMILVHKDDISGAPNLLDRLAEYFDAAGKPELQQKALEMSELFTGHKHKFETPADYRDVATFTPPTEPGKA